jgi:pyruvate,water dikinase
MSVFDKLKMVFNSGKRHRRQVPFVVLFRTFQGLLEKNNKILDSIAAMGDKLGGDYVFDKNYIVSSCQEVSDLVYKLIYDLDTIAPSKYLDLYDAFQRINHEIEEELAGRPVIAQAEYVIPFETISRDSGDVVGGKIANLAEVNNILGLPAPEGFVITTTAFKSFMENNKIWDRIREEPLTGEAGKEVRTLIAQGLLPPDLKRALQKGIEQLQLTAGDKKLFLAVRSSAWGEDGIHTFAGQFKTFLNQPVENLVTNYKEVIASAYLPSAIEYRASKDISEDEVAMAVGCQVTIDAKVSGVIYTLDPTTPEREVMVINAVWGLGAPLVSGQVPGDRYLLNRTPPHEVEGLNVRHKLSMLCPKEGGDTEERPVPENLQMKPCLEREEMLRLAEIALVIERYFKKPQDIEWALDKNSQIIILQTRPLNLQTQMANLVCNLTEAVQEYPVIFRGQGDIAQRGVGAGQVVIVRDDEDMEDFPAGAILVGRYTSPRLAKAVPKASGILTDVGSPTGHMATIAREFRVPTIVNIGDATKILKPGQEITVDAEENVVYDGRVKELCYYEFTEEPFEESYEYRLISRVLKKIAPLNLLNPHDKNFAPDGCRTFHDITRFVHEKAVEELLDLEFHERNMGAPAKKLKLSIPLGLVVIDMGGGLEESAVGSEVEPEQVISLPLKATLDGMMTPGMWSTEPVSVDLGSFMSSLTRTFSSSLATPKYLGQNLAMISKEYMNLSLRLGYHFNIIDAYISDKVNDNYAYFRFLGGVTDLQRRSRRARLLAELLEAHDFRVDVRGDLVVGRIKKLDAPRMVRKMKTLGHLVAFTRQLDVTMVSDAEVENSKETFDRLTAGAIPERN